MPFVLLPQKQVYLLLLFAFSLVFMLVQVTTNTQTFKIFCIPPLFVCSFVASKYIKKYSDYVDGLINVLVMFLITEVYNEHQFHHIRDLINFFIGQFAIILFVVYRSNNFLINLMSLIASYALVYSHLESSDHHIWIAIIFSFLVVIWSYTSSFFKRRTYLHKSYFKEIFQLDFPMNMFLTKYDKVTCRLILQDCNKLVFKRFKIEQDDQEGFSEFFKRIKVQQRRKSRQQLDYMNQTTEKETNLKEYLLSKYVKLEQELLQQQRRNSVFNFKCLNRKQKKERDLQDLINGKYSVDDNNNNQSNNLYKSVFNNENLFGYYYKKKEDSTYTKSFKIHMQLIDFYNEPSIAIFFEDETIQNDLVDVKMKKKKQKYLIVSTLNQVREKISSVVGLFRDYTEEYIIKKTKEMSVLLLNQTYNLFDYIYLKEKKKLMSKQLQADESTYKEQQTKFQLNLNLTEFSLKSLLKELYIVNPLIEIAYQEFGEETKSETQDQNDIKDLGIQDVMIYNDYKRILQVLLSLTFQQNISLAIKPFKEQLYSGLEFSFKYGFADVNNDLELDPQNLNDDGIMSTPPYGSHQNNQSKTTNFELHLNKNFSDKRLKDVDLYVIKQIVKEVGPKSMEVDKVNNTVSFRIFSDIKILQYDDEIKQTKNSTHNLHQKRDKFISITNRPSQKSIAGFVSQQNSSYCRTEVRNVQDLHLNVSPVSRTINHNQVFGQSPKQQHFKVDLKDQLMQKARRSTYSRTLPPAHFMSNNGLSILQSNHNIIENNSLINNEFSLLAKGQQNDKCKQKEIMFVKQVLSPFADSNNFFASKIDEISQNNTLDEGSDLPDIKMSKYQPTQ